MTEQVKLAVVYYSSTGTIDEMARRAAAAGEKAGAEVRLRQVEELAPPEVIESQEAWKKHAEATRDTHAGVGRSGSRIAVAPAASGKNSELPIP